MPASGRSACAIGPPQRHVVTELPQELRLRILFFAEAVTLAHVARPLVLAAAAAEAGHEVTIACDDRFRGFIESAELPWLPLHSIGRDRFVRALAAGSPVYDLPTLRRYVQDDVRLIEKVAPALVVGDFRLSLSVSARLARVRYATITNAYWSPHVARRRFPLPVLPLSRHLPLAMARPLFRAFAPVVMAAHCLPMNRLRRENELSPLGFDLRTVYTEADHTLYADAPGLFEMTDLPPTHRHLGPVVWAPPIAAPPWWDQLPRNRPIVYVTLGSSGDSSLLAGVLAAVAGLSVLVIASSAGAAIPGPAQPGNVRMADYLPGVAAARLASLVVCNGGSPTAQQALSVGVPVIGVASNMDQFLNMEAIVHRKAGRLFRADRFDARALRDGVAELLIDAHAQQQARALSAIFARHDAGANFNLLLRELDGLRTHEISGDHPS